MSDADRERVVGWLKAAVSEGRLTLGEFEERVDGVLHAKTYGEIEQYVHDLPMVSAQRAPAPAPREVVELRTVASSLKRRGRWTVPRRLIVSSKAGSVKLNFADAVIAYPVVEIELDVLAGSTELVLPDGSIVRVGGPAEDNPGYDLTGTIVGAEGTFGVVTKIWVRITPPF